LSENGTSPLLGLGMKLAVPYNHDGRLLSLLEPRAAAIHEVFIPAPLDVSGTFRAWNGPDPIEYRKAVPGIVRQAERIGLAVNMAVNAPWVPPADHRMVADYVRSAIEDGVASFTLGDLHLAEAVRDRCPGAVLVASATADIAHVTRARHWVRQAGVARIVPSRIVNKDLRVLVAMSRLGVIIELIPNEQCLPGCPYVFQHAMTIGRRNTVDEDDFRLYSRMCSAMKSDAPWEHYQTEIVPASIPRYRGIASLIKLAGRDAGTGYILGEVDRFIRLESDGTGFLGGYVEPPEVFDMVGNCDRVCEQCGWCRNTFVNANPDWRERGRHWLDRTSPSASGRS
jgi:collagenase-like PrtC family protease